MYNYIIPRRFTDLHEDTHEDSDAVNDADTLTRNVRGINTDEISQTKHLILLINTNTHSL